MNNTGVRGAVLVVGSLLTITLIVLFSTQDPNKLVDILMYVGILLFICGAVDLLFSVFKPNKNRLK